ncbi:putative bifunctional diguanylate cyclase/phosphodiesterase [Croceicoccus gelatinilyticus]|uniref:putative bifunctional diguanylate cyclase/phosphodiesterase n=1 Tax=Croceicoccus gelatinilyticus TaxID=2835536 RepID=UPI001CEC31E8|nr:EAL domain-containing protein [Croceicoccus gelatinilyticus]
MLGSVLKRKGGNSTPPSASEDAFVPESRDGMAKRVMGKLRRGEERPGRLVGLQYGALARGAWLRFAIFIAAALPAMVVWTSAAGGMIVGGWFALVVMMALAMMRIERTFTDAERRQLGSDELRTHLATVGLAGALWVAPMLIFPEVLSTGSAPQYAVMVMLIGVFVLSLSVVPTAAMVFIGIFGIGGAIGPAIRGDWVAAIAQLAFSGTIAGGALALSRLYLRLRITEASLAEKAETVSLLLHEFEENSADWLWSVDSSRRVRGVSPRFAHALQMQPHQADGQPLLRLIAGDGWESGSLPSSLRDLAERLKRRESFSNLMVRVNVGGRSRWWELSGTPKHDEHGQFSGFRGVGSDVTEQRESAEKIAQLARYDQLTGLPNRMMLTEALGTALQRAEQWRTRCAFLMIDLDRFKAVNDTLGHQIGDELLAQVSRRLRVLMGQHDTCGRLGGDEFAVVMADVNDRNAVDRMAHAIIDVLSKPYDVDHHTLYVGASVGSAIGPRDARTVETLMRNADLALYRSKDEGGGSHFAYEPQMHAHAEERRKLEFALRHALERDELTLAFQPVVDAETEQVMSFEALLRWNSAEFGPVSPAKFIPIAEDTRLIVPIGEWALRRACEEAARWPSNIRIAVNVSAEQMLDASFASTVVSALASSGLAAERLELEVTESIFLRDGGAAQNTLSQIQSLGCGIALDDFGTGYSSLGYLRNNRFTTIKIDRSFVTGAAKDSPESLAIIRAVVAMADALDMTTTAEGVESERELDRIRQLGCTKIQGFLFGRPMGAIEAAALLARDADRKIA